MGLAGVAYHLARAYLLIVYSIHERLTRRLDLLLYTIEHNYGCHKRYSGLGLLIPPIDKRQEISPM
jgi:hypothetical protein